MQGVGGRTRLFLLKGCGAGPATFLARPKLRSEERRARSLGRAALRKERDSLVQSSAKSVRTARRLRMRTIVLGLALVCQVPTGFAQTTLNMSQDLVRLGIATTNMTPN